MLSNDMASNVKVDEALASAQKTADFTGSGIDGKDMTARGIQARISAVGANTGDDYFDLSLEESDDDSTYTAYAGQPAKSTADLGVGDALVLPYDGIKRYYRLAGKVQGSGDVTLDALALQLPELLPYVKR